MLLWGVSPKNREGVGKLQPNFRHVRLELRARSQTSGPLPKRKKVLHAHPCMSYKQGQVLPLSQTSSKQKSNQRSCRIMGFGWWDGMMGLFLDAVTAGPGEFCVSFSLSSSREVLLRVSVRAWCRPKARAFDRTKNIQQAWQMWRWCRCPGGTLWESLIHVFSSDWPLVQKCPWPMILIGTCKHLSSFKHGSGRLWWYPCSSGSRVNPPFCWELKGYRQCETHLQWRNLNASAWRPAD